MNPEKVGILLVEDDPRLRDHIATLLGEVLPVVRTSSPYRAFEVLYRDPGPRWILITDYHLPEMTGAELIMSALRKSCKIDGVILMSGDPKLGELAVEARKGLEQEKIPFALIQKPFLPEELLDTLKKISVNLGPVPIE